MEVWKDIKGYEGSYQISNLGRLKSLPRKSKRRYKSKEIIKKPSKLPKGYLRIALAKNGTKKYFYIHRLVAEAFIPNPNELLCVNHKDCNTSNNNVDNLEWITHKDNNSYKNHHLKRHISSVLYFMNKDYPQEKEIIEELKQIKEKINAFK